MKILKIRKCGDPECPFFKCISNGENGYVGLCNIEKRYITELDRVPHKDSLWYESDVIPKPGVIPEWCPLEDEFDYRSAFI
jgi:hypothetical protein